MSIIQEALKKAQAYTVSKFPAKPPVEAISSDRRNIQIQNPLKPKAPDSRPKSAARPNIFLLVAFLLVLGIFLKLSLHTAGKARESQPVGEEPAFRQEVAYKAMSDKKDAGISPAAVAQAPKLVLNGIMYLSGKSQAVINDSVVEEGDTVSGARVVSINRNEVLLSFEDLDITLTLKK